MNRPEDRKWYTPDLWRDELPNLLWDWRAFRLMGGNQYRPANRPPVTYPTIARKAYRTGQATLSRAIQTLYAKGLIDCGPSYDPTGLKIYSERRAERMGITAEAPMTEDEMTKIWYPKETIGGLDQRPHSLKGTGEKPRSGRNVKSIRLTDEGVKIAETLNVKSLVSG